MKKIALLFLLSMTLIRCAGQGKTITHFRVDLADEYLARTIVKYVDENHVDIKRKVITIKAEVGLRGVFTITDEPAAFYKEGLTPTYYGVLNDRFVFFVFTRVEQTFTSDRTKIINEIDQLLQGLGITLLKNKNFTYSAPVWRVVRECDGTYRMTTKVTPLEFESVPCGYSIVRDSLKLDSIRLIKR